MSTEEPTVHIERTGTHRYIGRNDRGAELEIGLHDSVGAFSPGELLQVALAACAALSADHVLSRRLGDDFAARGDVSPAYDEELRRYEEIKTVLRVDLATVEQDKLEPLLERADRAIERLCAVGRTIDQPISHPVEIEHDTKVAELSELA